MAIFDEKIEIRERCKGVHCVDLGESFPTRIYLQKSASIQPRTSPSKFGGKYSILFIRVLTRPAAGVRAGCGPGWGKNEHAGSRQVSVRSRSRFEKRSL